MSISKKIFFYSVIILSCIIILLTLLSLIHDVKYWYFKILDFPRLQYLITGIILFIVFIFLVRKWNLSSIFLAIGLLVSIFVQGRFIYPYYFGEKTVLDTPESHQQRQNSFQILLANVLISNRKSDDFLRLINKNDPEIILAMEVNSWWIKELEGLEKKYPYTMLFPAENAYGMALYSKLPLKNEEIKFLNEKDVPSFHTEIVLESGQKFRFFGVHPVAPVPSDKYPDNEGEKEVALLKIGNLVEDGELPSIVAGDFNDVSWSNTSRLFQERGSLNNIRIGRGIYPTFNAKIPILRWPLDHFFVSKEFFITSIERLPSFGSDHFAISAEFVLNKDPD